MSNDPQGGDAPSGAGPDMFLLERQSLLSLIELLHTAAPEVEIDLQPSSVMRAVLHARASPLPPTSSPDERLRLAKAEYALRRRREWLLGANLFGEPAWDILLDLYIAQLENRQVFVPDACLASGAVSSTASRWVEELETRGLIVRSGPDADEDQQQLTLMPSTASALDDLLTPAGARG